MVYLCFTGPSHYVVHFHVDECLACVPKKNILRPNKPAVDSDCTVLWSDGSEYTATVVAMGKSWSDSAFCFQSSIHTPCTMYLPIVL